MRPIQPIALGMEQVFVSKAYRLARKFCEPRDISAFITDAVVCHPSNRQRKKLIEAAEDLRHGDGQQMLRVASARPCLVRQTDPPIIEAFDAHNKNCNGMLIQNRPLRKLANL